MIQIESLQQGDQSHTKVQKAILSSDQHSSVLRPSKLGMPSEYLTRLVRGRRANKLLH
jgi:hypothetical protein